jgi:hypothetical protein
VDQVCQVWAETSGVVSTQRCLDEWGRTQELLQSAFEDLFQMANGGMQSLLQDMEGVRKDLLALSHYLNTTEKSIKNFQWTFGLARALNLFLALLCLLIVLSVFCNKWSRLIRCVQSWITVPLFSVLVLLSFIFSLVCMLSSTALADFCVNGPDLRVLSILEVLKEDITDMIYDVAVYYVKQCPIEYVMTTSI